MRKSTKIVLIILGIVIAVGAVAVFFAIRHTQKYEVMDGPGMVYCWTDYQLHGQWVETDIPSSGKRDTMDIDETTICLTDGNGNETKTAYTLPEGVVIEGSPEGEVYLQLEEFIGFDSLIFHEEMLEGESVPIPVISGTIFEYDGRGEIVVAEFVRAEDLYILPEDYESSLMKARNSWEGVPSSYMVVPETEPAEITEAETEKTAAEDGSTVIEGDHAYRLKPLARDEENRITSWEITIDETGQIIETEIDPGSCYFPEDGTGVLREEDVNFDGRKDIVIYKGSLGAQGFEQCDCYLNDGEKFIPCKGYDEIPNPNPDEQSEKVYGTVRDGADRYYELTYEIQGDEAVKIGEMLYVYDEDAEDYLPMN